MRCIAGIYLLMSAFQSAVYQCEHEVGHEGPHLVYRLYYPVEDITDKRIKHFDGDKVDKIALEWN